MLAVEDAPTDIEGRLALVLRWLDHHPGWLLILDNVDSPEAAAEVQSLLGRLKAGHVVITSRIGNWRAGVEPLELHVLDEASAVGFLLERAIHRRQTDDEADQAAAVARDLDGLALALEQAGAYIDILHLSAAEYRRRWEARRAEVLAWWDAQVMNYPRSVATTWLTTLEQLDEPERRMLGALSWLAPEPIPLALFETEPMVEAFGDARVTLAGLARFSLVRFAEEGDGVTVHRLVQEIGRGRIGEEERVPTVKLALDAVDALAVGEPWDVRNWDVWTPLAPHAESVARQADAVDLAGPTARLLDMTGGYWKARGQYQAAEPL